MLWAGKIVEDAMGWLVDMGLIPGADRGISYATPYMRVRFTERFVSMEGCVFSSSAIMGGSRTTWKATYQIYAALCVQPRHSAAELYAAVDSNMATDVQVRVDAYNRIGLPHDNGWLPMKFRHLRDAN